MNKTLKNVRDALIELMDLMDGVREGDYKPDSFTNQPARQALSELEDYMETGGWSDNMDDAPTDGTEILVIGGNICTDLGGNQKCVSATKVSYNPDPVWADEDASGRWVVKDTCYYQVWVENPTRWQPLPKQAEV